MSCSYIFNFRLLIFKIYFKKTSGISFSNKERIDSVGKLGSASMIRMSVFFLLKLFLQCLVKNRINLNEDWTISAYVMSKLGMEMQGKVLTEQLCLSWTVFFSFLFLNVMPIFLCVRWDSALTKISCLIFLFAHVCSVSESLHPYSAACTELLVSQSCNVAHLSLYLHT